MKDRIREIRKAAGLNQKDFGSRIGVAQTTIAGYENGSRALSGAAIKSICREFNIREEWLRTGEGERKVSDKLGALIEGRDLPPDVVQLLDKLLSIKPDMQKQAVDAILRLIDAFDHDPPGD